MKPTDIQTTLNERGSNYGSFVEQAAASQRIKCAMYQSLGDRKLEPDQREALEMLAVKVSRILTGDPDHLDSWVDIAGYSQLIVNRLTTGKSHVE